VYSILGSLSGGFEVFYLQGYVMQSVENKPSRAWYLLHARFSLDLFFVPEDVSYIFLLNVG
jgi:hypothetical protein